MSNNKKTFHYIIPPFFIRSLTNSDDNAKQYFHLIEFEMDKPSLVIRKLVLSKNPIYYTNFRVIKIYKDYNLFEQYFSIKLETLSKVISVINGYKKPKNKKIFNFVVKHKIDCYHAFKEDTSHKGYHTEYGKNLITLARKELEYSPKTWSGDIYLHLWKVYKSIVIDGVNSPDKIKK